MLTPSTRTCTCGTLHTHTCAHARARSHAHANAHGKRTRHTHTAHTALFSSTQENTQSSSSCVKRPSSGTGIQCMRWAGLRTPAKPTAPAIELNGGPAEVASSAIHAVGTGAHWRATRRCPSDAPACHTGDALPMPRRATLAMPWRATQWRPSSVVQTAADALAIEERQGRLPVTPFLVRQPVGSQLLHANE